MDKCIVLVPLVLSAFSNDVLAQEADGVKALPQAQSARSRNIDVKHIAIDLRFDWPKKQAYGTSAVTFATLKPADKITLDAGMLTINAVSLNGIPLKYTYAGGDTNDGLEIALDRVYEPSEEAVVRIDYRTNWVNATDPNNLWGSSGKGIRFFEPSTNDRRRPREIWSMGEPESNRYWFPGYDSPDDLRTTEFTATVDRPLMVLSNGNLAETKANPDGTRTFRWDMRTPYANHLTSFVIGEYVEVKQNHQGIGLHHYGYPGETQAVAASVARLPDMVEFYSDYIGVRYPYPDYSQVFVQDLPGWAGNITTSAITENMIDDDRTHADFFYLWDLTEGEALASQWFGSHLTSRNWSDVWLNKAFPHYFSGLYDEHKNGRDEFLLFQRAFDQSTYLSDWNSGNRRPIVTRHYENALEFTAGNYPYSRGASVLHMLRKHLGEDTWRKAIGLYVRSNANKSVSTEDFRKAVEAAGGEPMGWFFDQWLYKMGHPVFEVSKNYDGAKGQLALRVKQTQAIDPKSAYPQVRYFKGKVEIEIDGKLEQVWIKPKPENIFRFSTSQAPKLVHFDYQSTWIKEIKFKKSLDELVYQLLNDRDVLGKSWAMGELTDLARDEKTSSADRAKIYAGLRSLIVSDSYWRIRTQAIARLQSLLVPAAGTKPVVLDEATVAMLLAVIKNDTSWVRAGAIGLLGMTREAKFDDLYLSHFNDESDRVINAAAIALGRSKSPKAFDALAKLVGKPSWKNQSLMSALSGLKELGDPRGFEVAFKALSDLDLARWRLPNPPVWDLRVFAADTIAALGRGDAAYPLIHARFKKAMEENDINGLFNNALLVATLADPRGQEVFDQLKIKFKDDANAMTAVDQYQTQFKEAIKQD